MPPPHDWYLPRRVDEPEKCRKMSNASASTTSRRAAFGSWRQFSMTAPTKKHWWPSALKSEHGLPLAFKQNCALAHRRHGDHVDTEPKPLLCRRDAEVQRAMVRAYSAVIERETERVVRSVTNVKRLESVLTRQTSELKERRRLFDEKKMARVHASL